MMQSFEQIWIRSVSNIQREGQRRVKQHSSASHTETRSQVQTVAEVRCFSAVFPERVFNDREPKRSAETNVALT